MWSCLKYWSTLRTRNRLYLSGAQYTVGAKDFEWLKLTIQQWHMLFLDDQNYQGRAIRLSNPIEKLSDFIESGRDSSEDVGFLGTEFRWEVVGCRSILESNRNPDILALSDIRQLPIGILSQGFYRNSLDPIGSYWVHSSWVASEIFIVQVSLYFSFTILFHFNRISSFEWQRIRTRSFWRD